ncbi:type II secretion system protein [Rugamonas sp. CCM 8940]|uniref:type II secretion system protein n=1 Tax=Rugamonas sp. CCM 8940 TaxID=2765359 RepID=UPI0018F4C557|nr:hypothetical protein [Rugamonas sp. CCM 8940]MBJ7313588.1 hypothetical protein [Rugamonas sp. CCM 8940]
MSRFTFHARTVSIQQQRRQGGAGLMEFAVSASVVAILAAMLLSRLYSYQGEAERVAMQYTVSAIRSVLQLKQAQARLPEHPLNLAQLAEQNPLELLDRKPRNYLGEFYSPDVRELAPGNWYFDRDRKILVYLLNERSVFGDSSLKQLQFKVKLLRLPLSPAKPSSAPEMSGATLEQLNG